MKPTELTFSRYTLEGEVVYDVLRNGQATRRPTPDREAAIGSLTRLMEEERAAGHRVDVVCWDGDAGQVVASAGDLP